MRKILLDKYSTQLLKIFSDVYTTRQFIVIFKNDLPLVHIHGPVHPFFIFAPNLFCFISLLYSHLCLGFHSGLFSSEIQNHPFATLHVEC